MFGGGKKLVIHNFCHVNGFSLGSIHVNVSFCDHPVVDGGLGGRGELGVVALLVILLVHDKAQNIVDPLLHIIRDREEDHDELITESLEISVGGLSPNGVEYVKPCCKQQLDFFQLHGGEGGHSVGSKAEVITQGRGREKYYGLI